MKKSIAKNTAKTRNSERSIPKAKYPTEDVVQAAFVSYIKEQHPHLIIKADYLSGKRMSVGLATKAKRMGNTPSYPDLWIAEPTKFYCGLYIELKRYGIHLRKRNGEWAREHFQNQYSLMLQLRAKGYWADFAIGLDESKLLLNRYLDGGRMSSVHF